MKHSVYLISRLIVPVLLSIVIFSCTKDDTEPTLQFPETGRYDSEVALKWNEFFLEIERFTPGYRPPVSGRAAGYIGLAAYESVINGMEHRYNSFDGFFPGLDIPEIQPGEEYHWPTCLNAAYARAFSLFFPTAPAAQLFELYALERDFNETFQEYVPDEVFVRSWEYGRAVAEAVFSWSATDPVGHEAYRRNHDPQYAPPAGQGLWQPTYPDYTPALLPYWGQVRTFVADVTDGVPDPLPVVDQVNSPIYQQAKEVQVLVNQVRAGQKIEDRWIADFWSDDCPILTFTPAARWIAVANQVVEREDVSLDVAVETYARVGMALCDAGIRCWNEKYRFNIERPVDYIRRVMGDANWNTVMCPDGSGNYFTPPFPAYPSGHATFGAAAAEVLADIFGSRYQMTDRCHEGRSEFMSAPRSFDSFFEMAEENAYSRIPLGVHFRMDAEAGVDLGYRIGKKVNQLPWRK